MNQHSPEVPELIERGKLFPASKLLNPEKTKAPDAAAEVNHHEAETV